MIYTEILKDKRVFARLYKKGRFVASREVTVYFLPNRLGRNRFGITVGKKLGGAVVRNRAKRIIRSAYRQCEGDLPVGYDYVFVARGAVIGKKSTDIEKIIRTKLLKGMAKRVEKNS